MDWSELRILAVLIGAVVAVPLIFLGLCWVIGGGFKAFRMMHGDKW